MFPKDADNVLVEGTRIRHRYGDLPRSAPTIAALVAMASAVVMIAVDQIRFRYPRDFVWPLFFEQYHVLGVVAILCLAIAAVSELSEQRCSSVR